MSAVGANCAIAAERTPGRACDALQQVTVGGVEATGCARDVALIAAVRLQPHDEEVLAIETPVAGVDALQAGDKESGGEEQHETERHLSDDEHAAGAQPIAGAGGASPLLPESREHVDAPQAQRRRETAENAGRDRYKGGEQQDPAIGGDVEREGARTSRHKADEDGGCPTRDDEGQRAAEGREQHVLEEQLPDQLQSAGTQGEPHREFRRT